MSFVILGIWLVTTIPLAVVGAALLVYLAIEMLSEIFLHHYLEPLASIEGIIVIHCGPACAAAPQPGDGHKGEC